MELHFIGIPKLRKLDNTHEIFDMLEAWVTFIQNPESKLIEKLEMSANSKERDMYERRKESILKRISFLEGSEEKGFKRGIEKGIKQGIEQGIEQISKNLIANNFDTHLIQNLTVLTLEEIENLKQNL